MSVTDHNWKPFDPEATKILVGMLLKVKDTTFYDIYLVGNVNKYLGVCDDCTNFSKKDIIEYCTDYVKEMEDLTITYYEDHISKNTLDMIDSSMKNLAKGKVSDPVDLTEYKEIIEE